MADDSYGDRTEKGTGKRREETRRKGSVAKSGEISSVSVLLAGFSILYGLSVYVVRELSSAMIQGFQKIENSTLSFESILDLRIEILWTLFLVLSPVLIGMVAVAVLSNYAQVGSLFTLEAIQPKMNRLNPIPGFSRFFSKEAAVTLLKSLGKFLIIGWVAFSVIQKELPDILTLTDREAGDIMHYVGLISSRIFFKTLMVMAGLAVLDYFFQRWNYEKNLRMTKREVQEEYKQLEGDPQIKSRIRSIQRDLARKRMMAEVPKADVIITNPTHLAVALHYKQEEMNAPKVLAKGAGYIAEKIKEIARTHQIPVMENKPLAQILYRTVDLGQTIPSTLYQMVADLLAHVYRMKNRAL